jgi:uncharacterized membrane protein YebE (DUF533 family)
MIINVIGSLLRHGLTAGGGAVLATGLATGNTATDALGALMALGGLGWSLYGKYKAGQLTLADAEDAVAEVVKDVKIVAAAVKKAKK